MHLVVLSTGTLESPKIIQTETKLMPYEIILSKYKENYPAATI